jgi:hypothetical protein
MPRFLTLFACIAAMASGGCNQRAAVLDTPAGPTATPSPRPDLASMVIAPVAVYGGEQAQGTVLLTGPAATPGVVVSLSSSDKAATVPSEVVIPPGSSSAGFSIVTGQFPEERRAIISATVAERTVSSPNLEVWSRDTQMYFNYVYEIGGRGTIGRFVPGSSTFSAYCANNAVYIQIVTPGADRWFATFRAPGGAAGRAPQTRGL